MPETAKFPRFKIQRLTKLSNLEEFHILFIDADEQVKYHAPDVVFGRFLYYEEEQSDVFEKSIQCRLILYDELEKEQIEGLLEELFYTLGLEEYSSATDVFFAPRERAFSLYKEIGEEDYEEEEDEGEEGEHSGTELDVSKLSLPKKDEPEKKGL
ncbi:MAG: hypothetical protein RBG13Loki_3694 [Promethearchaeota archaeon CR_4]|nr:MAG: hypothetical protein RBG13Loki_3694 [Candidatus Lokiarchaeota archaeon CR_4]